MNQIERLKADLARRFPDITMEIDAPDDDRGSWFLDVRRPGVALPVVVEWRTDRGFGVSTPGPDDFGTGPDEVYTNAKAAFDRVTRLIMSGGQTEPPQAVRLAELRQRHGLSQAELARMAGVGQANISQIERREDLLVSTLTKILAAMGASVSIRAHFPKERGVDVEIVFPPVSDDLGTAIPVQIKTLESSELSASSFARTGFTKTPTTGGEAGPGKPRRSQEAKSGTTEGEQLPTKVRRRVKS